MTGGNKVTFVPRPSRMKLRLLHEGDEDYLEAFFGVRLDEAGTLLDAFTGRDLRWGEGRHIVLERTLVTYLGPDFYLIRDDERFAFASYQFGRWYVFLKGVDGVPTVKA